MIAAAEQVPLGGTGSAPHKLGMEESHDPALQSVSRTWAPNKGINLLDKLLSAELEALPQYRKGQKSHIPSLAQGGSANPTPFPRLPPCCRAGCKRTKAMTSTAKTQQPRPSRQLARDPFTAPGPDFAQAAGKGRAGRLPGCVHMASGRQAELWKLVRGHAHGSV